MNRTTHPASQATVAHTRRDIAQWTGDLARIRAVARRRRLMGRPDVALEAGCAVLERRLGEMRKEAEPR
jgi:hypothetical protein